MNTYKIEYYTSSDNTSELLDHEEQKFNDIDEGIEYIVANTTGLINEATINEPNRAVILLDTKYYDEEGNEITDQKTINEDIDGEIWNSVNYVAEIELIEEIDE